MTLLPVTRVPRRGAVPRERLVGTAELARTANVHPDLIPRFVALGLLSATADAEGRLSFTPDAPVRLARVQRLRVGLSLNYSAIAVVLDLLARIDDLERQLRTRPYTDFEGRPPWT
jgi:chaperone modulatory protein CbpM